MSYKYNVGDEVRITECRCANKCGGKMSVDCLVPYIGKTIIIEVQEGWREDYGQFTYSVKEICEERYSWIILESCLELAILEDLQPDQFFVKQ